MTTSTGPGDWLLSFASLRRELRCYRGLEVHAGRLLDGCDLGWGDVGYLLRVGFEELVERGVLEPVRHAPWMPVPPFMRLTFAAGDGLGRVETCDWHHRRTHPVEWYYRVPPAPQPTPPPQQEQP